MVLDVDPFLFAEGGVVGVAEETFVLGGLPDGVPIAVAGLGQAGVEVADDVDVGDFALFLMVLVVC